VRNLKMINLCKLLLAALFLCLSPAMANLGSPKAQQSGTFLYNLETSPPTLNPLSSQDVFASRVQAYVIESLLNQDLDSYEWQAALATKWSISKDGKVFEFTLREGVKWHDGKPLTPEDVKFSFEAIMHPENKYNTAHQKSYFESIKGVEIIGKNKVRFTAKKTYFRNFDVVAGQLDILPRHIYENPSKKEKKKLNKTLVGTGPYFLDKFQRGKKLILKRNPNWWGNKLEAHKWENNFKKVQMKFVKDETIALTMVGKGNLDFISMNSESFVKKANGKRWGKSAFKVKIQNKAPKSYAFIGWNLNNPLFKSKKTRMALYHLVNRKLMIKKFMYDMALPARGPLYLQSPYANPRVKVVEFDPKRALKLLREDGWEDSDGDQIVDKVIDGKLVKFSFTILEPLQDFIKFLTVFKEDAKKAGIDVKVKYVEWNTFIKLLDERKFQAVRLAWGGGSVKWDPKQVWHSSSIANKGSNFISYKNPKVDKLIDEARKIMDTKKRTKVLHQVFKLIAEDVPYVFFFNSKYGFYGHTKRMKRVRDTYTYGVGLGYWWIQK